MLRNHLFARHLLSSTLILAVVLVSTIAALGVITFTMDPAALINGNRERIEALSWKHLHRRLTLGPVEATWFPTFQVTIRGLELSGVRPGEPAMLKLGDIAIRMRLARALRTFGTELVIEELHIDGGTLRIRRGVDGSLDVLDVVSKLPPFDYKMLADDVILRIRAERGRVEFIDETSELTGSTGVVPPTFVLHELTLRADDAAVDMPLDVQINALWEGPDAAVDIAAHIDRVPKDLQFWPLPTSDARVRADGIDAAGLFKVFGLDILGGVGVLDATIAIDADQHMQAFTDLEAHDFGSNSIGARVISARLHGLSDFDLKSGDMPVCDLAVRSDVVDFDAELALDGEAAQGIGSLFLAADSNDLAIAGAMLPWLRDATGLRFSGVGSLLVDVDDEGNASGWLGLDGARVKIGEALDKQPGQLANLELIGTRSRDGLETRVRAALPGNLVITGVARALGGDQPGVWLDLKSNTVAVRRVGTLSPIVHDVLNGLAEKGSVSATLRGELLEFTTDLDLRLFFRGLEVVQERTRITGDANLDFGVFTSLEGMRLNLRLRLDDLSVRTVDDSDELLVEKRAGVPCRVDALLFERGGHSAMARGIERAGSTGAILTATGLTPRWQRIVTGLGGSGRVSLDELQLGPVVLDTIRARVDINSGGRVRLRQGNLNVMGGAVSLSGSGAELAANPLRWIARVQADDVDVGLLLAPLEGFLGKSEGKLALTASLDGAGVSIAPILTSLEGPVTVTTSGVRFGALQPVSQVIETIWAALERLPGVQKSRVDEGGFGRPEGGGLADGTWTFVRTRDRYRLDEPMQVETTIGIFSLTGQVGFDAKIELFARLGLNPDWLRILRLPPGETLPVTLKIAGTWDHLQTTFEDVDVVFAALREHLARLALTPVADAVEALTGQTVERDADDGLFRAVERALQKAADAVQRAVNAEVNEAERSVQETIGPQPQQAGPDLPDPAPTKDEDEAAKAKEPTTSSPAP